MTKRLDEIARDVRIAIDQNGAVEDLLTEGDETTLTLDEIIRSKVVDGVRAVHESAPVEMLDGGKAFGDAIYWREMESGYVLLPDDWMRLIVFEMSDWSQPVTRAITADDAEYARQRSRYKGVRGTAERPVCAVTVMPEGRVLEFYSCKSEDARIRRAMYMPLPEVDDDGGIEISERLYRAAVYKIAALTVGALGSMERAAALEAQGSGLTGLRLGVVNN